MAVVIYSSGDVVSSFTSAQNIVLSRGGNNSMSVDSGSIAKIPLLPPAEWLLCMRAELSPAAEL